MLEDKDIDKLKKENRSDFVKYMNINMDILKKYLKVLDFNNVGEIDRILMLSSCVSSIAELYFSHYEKYDIRKFQRDQINPYRNIELDEDKK